MSWVGNTIFLYMFVWYVSGVYVKAEKPFVELFCVIIVRHWQGFGFIYLFGINRFGFQQQQKNIEYVLAVL